MTDESRSLAIEGVRFFGEMSASVSHEIKNVLAIINENAGLLQDMVAMSARGMPLSPERLTALAQSMSRQVARGDGIVKNMNRFAHSADHPVETVDVCEVIEFVADLAGRLIAMKGNPPRIERPEASVTLATNRFYLENLIWACLCRAVEACRPEKEIAIFTDRSDTGVRIRFQGMAAEKFTAGAFPSSREKMVCRMLDAQIDVHETGKDTVIDLHLHPSGKATAGNGL